MTSQFDNGFNPCMEDATTINHVGFCFIIKDDYYETFRK